MSEEQALDYPLNRAFALKNFMIESNPHARVIYETPGYIAQEVRVAPAGAMRPFRRRQGYGGQAGGSPQA